MGPYCRFCDQRCFVPLPIGTPPHIRRAYGSSTIVATCPAGQRYERERVGYCYDDVRRAITGELTPADAERLDQILRRKAAEVGAKDFVESIFIRAKAPEN